MPRRHVNARARRLPNTATASGKRHLELFWLNPWDRRALGRRWSFVSPA